MHKCPYCYEEMSPEGTKCPSCRQFIIDDVVETDYPSLEKKKCIFCGRKILSEAKFCRFCHKWLDELDRAIDNIDPEDLV